MRPFSPIRLAVALVLALTAAWSAGAQQPPAVASPPPGAPPPIATASPAPQPGIEPDAVAILKTTSEKLAAAKTISFNAVSTYESPAVNGQPLYYTTVSQVTLERPNKLRVMTPGDGPPTESYYNGKTMVAYDPATNLVAVADAPPTIDAMVKAAYDKAAIYFPFVDFIHRCRPVQGHGREPQIGFCGRTFRRHRWNLDRHGGDRRRQCAGRTMDRGRRQAPADDPSSLSERPGQKPL